MRMRMVFTAALLAAAVLWRPVPAAADETYYVVSDDGSYGGFSPERFLEMAREIFRVAGNKLGVRFEVSLRRGEDALYQAVLDGDADLVISGVDYPRALDHGVRLKPWVALEIDGKVGYHDCIWVRTESEMSSVADMKDGSILGLAAPSLKKILYDGGFDMTFEEFFSEFALYRDPVEAVEQVLDGEFDSLFMGDNYMSFLMFDEKIKKGVRPLACSDELYPTQFLIREDLAPEFVERMSFMVQNAHRDPDFSAVRFVFITLKARMVPVEHDDFKNNIELYKLVDEKGWRDELEHYLAQYGGQDE